MKKYILFTLFAAMLYSCTENEHTLTAEQSSLHTTINSGYRIGDAYPINSDNPFDNAGSLHNELVERYYSGKNLPADLDSIALRVKIIADSIPELVAIKSASPSNFNISIVEYMLAYPTSCASTVISATTMSAEGKLSLSGFIDAIFLLPKKEDDYSSFYAFVCAYENDVFFDNQLSTEDRRIIQVTTSIVRHSVYRKKKKPKKNTDLDWTIWIANSVGAIHGGGTGIHDAVLTAAISGIAQNP